MKKKALADIKHGQFLVNTLEVGKLYFVDDIKKATGLDNKTLKNVLNRLLKNEYLSKNDRGQWFVAE